MSSAPSVLKSSVLPGLRSSAFRLSAAGCLLASALCGSAFAQTNVFPSTGNVGVGTTAPLNRLDVLGGSHSTLGGRNVLGDDGNYNPILRQYRWTGGGANYYPSTITTTGDQGGIPTLKFQVGSLYSPIGTESLIDVMTLKGTGNVGIGTTSPQARLDVNGGVEPLFVRNGGTSRLFIGVNQAGGGHGRIGVYDDGAPGWKNLVLAEGGNVGIGETNPLAKLHINTGSSTSAAPDLVLSGKHEGALFANGGIRSNGFQQNGQPYSGGISLQRWWFNGTSYVFEDALNLTGSGNVGIGTTNPTHKLAVNGTIRAKEVIVDTGWADYVFADDYRLAPLSEVEAHIKASKHLPGIPSATEVAERGVSVGEMQAKLLAKVEELTLHQIAQEKKLEAVTAENTALRREVETLKHAIRP